MNVHIILHLRQMIFPNLVDVTQFTVILPCRLLPCSQHQQVHFQVYFSVFFMVLSFPQMKAAWTITASSCFDFTSPAIVVLFLYLLLIAFLTLFTLFNFRPLINKSYPTFSKREPNFYILFLVTLSPFHVFSCQKKAKKEISDARRFVI